MTDKKATWEICEEFLKRSMDMNDLPGLAIGVSREGEHWSGALGVRDIKTDDPLKAGDVFHCASVSKLFTATGIQKLVETGSLDYDDRLLDVLPDLDIADERAEDIRIWQMLSHTSGLGDVEDYEWQKALTGKDALADYVHSDEVCQLPLLWEPGKGGFRYSNIAYEILGHIISVKSEEYREKTGPGSGRLSYEDFIWEELMEPTGMRDSTMKTFERIGVTEGDTCPLIADAIREQNAERQSGAFMALPHEKGEDRSIKPVEHYPYTRSHAPSSTLTSTLEDLLKWGDRHISEEVDPHIRYEYATVPNNGEKMGLGWFMREQKGHMLYGHEGTDDGFRASFWTCPELSLTIVVLSNLSGAPVKKINKKLFDEIA